MLKKTAALAIAVLGLSLCLAAQTDTIEFTKENWYLSGQVVDHLGQKALRGQAVLKDVEFENGIIELDMAFEGGRCFGMSLFRVQKGRNQESVYLRPHKTGKYDALQYTPVWNGLGSWQLYYGDGSTATAQIPHKRWVHVKLEVLGTQARLFLDNAPTPALVIHELKRGTSSGGIGLTGPANALAHFANFRFEKTDDLAFAPPPPPIAAPPGMLMDWELSQPLSVTEINREEPLDRQDLPRIEWTAVAAEASGLVDIGRHVLKSGQAPETVLARTFIEAEASQLQKLNFGYSDQVSIFLNGRILFRGNSEFRLRDPESPGLAGLNDSVFLPLEKGRNELLLMVSEVFGGWGFLCRLGALRGEAEYRHPSVSRLWEAATALPAPESACYDPDSDAVYVSNYNADYLSKLALDGSITERKWVSGVNRPTGIVKKGGRLFAAERTGLAEIDIATASVIDHHPIPEAGFPNDVALGPGGELYVSDSQRSVIYRFDEGRVKVWLDDPRIVNPNGLHCDGERLIVGTSADGCFKAVDTRDKNIKTLLRLGPGAVMDGIQKLANGDYVMGDWNGRIFRVSPDGTHLELLDTRDAKLTLADFEYIPSKKMLIIPTLYGNRVLAFKLEDTGLSPLSR